MESGEVCIDSETAELVVACPKMGALGAGAVKFC